MARRGFGWRTPGPVIAALVVAAAVVGVPGVPTLRADAAASISGIVAWGAAEHGQLGNNSLVDSNVPVKMVLDAAGALGTARIKQVSGGGQFGCLLTTGNAVYCWGEGSNGRLGNGGTLDSRIDRKSTRLNSSH